MTMCELKDSRDNLVFILEDDPYGRKLIFEFDTHLSSCHSFNEKPPKSWQEVYKVYYEYRIVWRYENKEEENRDYVLFETCDECSALDAVGHRLQNLKKKHYTILPTSDSICWEISKWDRSYRKDIWLIELWEMCTDRAYRIFLSEEKAKEFGKFLVGCCEYMLEHGEGM